VFIDGASRGNPGPAGIGIAILPAAVPGRDGEPTPIRQVSKYLGETTNNVAEYLALVYALHEARTAGYRQVIVKTDSELVSRQIGGTYQVRDPVLRVLHDLALHLMREFASVRVEHIPRTANRLADRLAGQAVRGRTAAPNAL